MAFQPPNQTGPAGTRVNNGFLPLAHEASSVNPPNHGPGGDHKGGSYPLGGMASPVQPPNHKFAVGSSKMPQPPSAVEPGRGAIPVEPFGQSGQPRLAMSVPDMRSARR
jgi:hypothetical protein